jgi:hypothetical protein
MLAAMIRRKAVQRRPMAARLAGLLLLVAAGTAAAPASADVSGLHTPADIEKSAPRLSGFVKKLYDIGVKPYLTVDERSKLGEFELRFPLPSPKDPPLDFYADEDNGKPIVVLPILSLRMVEDMATAYAWLHHNGMSYGSIDLYFSMLRHKPKADFPGGKYPPLLATLAIPTNALDDKKVDELSLAFRNQTVAFLLVHELGHILYRHKGIDEITKARARADEVASDRFALDVLARTQTAPLGAVLFFQAQVYRLPHRGEFPTRKAWEEHLLKTETHPLTVDRIGAMADYIDGPLSRGRVKEVALWRFIALKLREVVRIMEDEPLQRCTARVAATADLSILKPRRDIPREEFMRLCKGTR